MLPPHSVQTDAGVEDEADPVHHAQDVQRYRGNHAEVRQRGLGAVRGQRVHWGNVLPRGLGLRVYQRVVVAVRAWLRAG
jgi:hypothetical protein